MRKYEQHPLSAAFPAMSDGDFMLLCHDIREHGLRDPGVLYDGMVLDGWHRYRACLKEKVDFIATVLPDGVDPAAFVISRNRHRRHLTLSQISVAVVRCKEWAPAHRPNKVEPGSTLSEVAKEVGASTKTIQQAKIAVAAGLGDAVRDGMMTVKDAAHVAKGTAPKPAKRDPDEPEMVDEDDPETDALIAREQEEVERGKARLAEILMGDDPLSAMTRKCAELTEMNAVLTSRITGLQNELLAMTRSAKSWMRKAKANGHDRAAA